MKSIPMTADTKTWETWLARLYNLRRDKTGTHERPHKPVLLLSIMELLDRGILKSNSVPFSDELVGTFKRYFTVVKAADDKPTIENPFYYLSGDGFWDIYASGNEEPLYGRGAMSTGQLRKHHVEGRFDGAFWVLMGDAVSRHQLREALIARYFPEHRDAIAAVSADTRNAREPDRLKEEDLPPGRDGAFRKAVLEIYDYRCAACGVRIILDQTISLVEAAHLIPFSMSRNDKPDNGLALCPNHHWAMDRHLIAPCPDAKRPAGIWRINEERLDDRIEGQRDLVSIANRPVIPPSEDKFYPAIESLRWRERHLKTRY